MGVRRIVASLGIAAILALAAEATAQDNAPPARDSLKAAPTPGGVKPVAKKKADTPAPKDETSKADPAKDGEKDKAKDGEKDKDAGPKKPKIERATLGGGCFWSFEATFERVPGVISVTSGFSGGNVPNPSYEMVCTGQTGHAEVIQVEYDANIIPYEKLLKFFWTAHDPTTPNSQGDDFGTQYRSIILFHSAEQQKTAIKVYQELKASKKYRAPIVTDLVKFVAFFPAEPYHQDYFRNHPYNEYSINYIIPKLRKLKLMR
jgi:peptide-methionine (S)-S-oxide reductase